MFVADILLLKSEDPSKKISSTALINKKVGISAGVPDVGVAVFVADNPLLKSQKQLFQKLLRALIRKI
jgi:hypothetical protein